jgi:hypothetical protein
MDQLRVARFLVRLKLKEQGERISSYGADDITKAAKLLIEAQPAYVEWAGEQIAKLGE